VPFHWVRFKSSPPKQRRNEVRQICQRHGGRLCENEIFYGDADDVAHALIQVPDDPAKQQALLNELGATEALGQVNADEKEAGKRPPQSRP
jgi:hypothetical protein